MTSFGNNTITEIHPQEVRFLREQDGRTERHLKINVAAVMGLRFCPACGRNLEELVQESPDFFNELAGEHKKFLASMPGM